MKLTNIKSHKRKSGMTLLELTVVILVLLSLISILFIGARAWKKGSDRAGCILNIRNMQQAVRSHANMQGLNPGEGATAGDTITGFDLTAAASNPIIGPGKFMENAPECPGNGTYSLAVSTVPAIGELTLECTLETTEQHVPTTYGDW